MRQRFSKHKKLLIWGGIGIIILLMVVFSRNNKTPDTQVPLETTKKPFYIETIALGDTGHTDSEIIKTGKITGTSNITVTAGVGGRVERLVHQIGDTVANDTLIVKLADTYSTYGYASQKAGLSVDSAKNTYLQQLESLQKQIDDAQIAYEKAKLQSESAAADALKQLEKTKYDLQNASDIPGSLTRLQLEKLENDLQKAQFDYNSKLTADDQTIANYLQTTENTQNDIAVLMRNVLYQTDKILGITAQHRLDNDAYETALSATNTSYLYSTQRLFYELQNQQKSLEARQDHAISTSTIQDDLNSYRTDLAAIIALLEGMQQVLTHTVPGGNLPESDLRSMKALFDGYQTQAQATVTAITNQLNSINSFFATYKDAQSSLAKSVTLLHQQIDITKKSLADGTFSAQIGYDRTQISAQSNTKSASLSLESAQSALDYVTQTKNTTLKNIENTRKQAEVAYAEAETNISKLMVHAPISGQITDVFVDLGQEVTPGTPLFKIVSEQQEIEFTLQPHELNLVQKGQAVIVRDDEGHTVRGILVAKADAEDKNGTFKAIVQLEQNILTVGSFVKIILPVRNDIRSIDLNVVRIVDNGIGEIFLWHNEEVQKMTIQLGNMIGQQIEVRSTLPSGAQLILTDLAAYDPQIMEIKVIKK